MLFHEGAFHADPDTVDRLTRQTWDQMYQGTQPNKWSSAIHVLDKYAHACHSDAQWHLPAITGEHNMQVL